MLEVIDPQSEQSNCVFSPKVKRGEAQHDYIQSHCKDANRRKFTPGGANDVIFAAYQR